MSPFLLSRKETDLHRFMQINLDYANEVMENAKGPFAMHLPIDTNKLFKCMRL